MEKKRGVLIFIVAVIVCFTVSALSYRKERDNIEYTGQYKFTGTVGPVVFDGAASGVSISNASGLTCYGVAEFEDAIIQQTVNPSAVSPIGFTVSLLTEGNIYFIDGSTTTSTGTPSVTIGPSDGTGVTVVLPTPTADTDGAKVTIFKSDSGATDVFAWASGLPIGSASGTTDNKVMDAQGDAITFVADYNSAVSWWIISTHIQ